jgi:predicted transcriptional regulator of viral defense system
MYALSDATKEKTIVVALDLPRHAGGTGIVAGALRASWNQLDEARLRRYVVRIGNSAAGLEVIRRARTKHGYYSARVGAERRYDRLLLRSIRSLLAQASDN